MTIIKPVNLACPSCHGEGRHYSTQSTNNIGWRQWSDGWGEGHYGSTQCGLLHCSTCDFVFPESQCERREETEPSNVPHFLGRAPKGNTNSRGRNVRKTEPSLFERMLLHSQRGENNNDDFDNEEPEDEWDLTSERHSTKLSSLNPSYDCDSGGSARKALTSGRWLGEGTELLLRLQWWWDWNSLSRADAPTADAALNGKKSERKAIPDDLADNLKQLVDLLAPDRDALIVGEILRRFGRYEEARKYYEADTKAPLEWRRLLSALAQNGTSVLVELPIS